ncbi:MAG: hypothetical protein JW965_08005 [Bacteroidales bacterium]|nr:hypothetical protein [Bacteroidales bacterium]
MNRVILLSLAYFIILIYPSFGQSGILDMKNQLSLQSTLNFGDDLTGQLGGRYIPTLSIKGNLKKNRSVDAEISVNSYANFYYADEKFNEHDWKLKPYRIWLRYFSPRFEIRAGLQKISFGSASILRPLMWFDKIDYRDPLQLTDGVYGLLGRYYFQNNANIWLWALYGNKDTKGWEIAPTRKNRAEYGGRLQIPFLTGEIAVSYHCRHADYSAFYVMQPGITEPFFTDQLLGFDAKLDIGPGIWFEYTWKINDDENILFVKNEHYLNIGMDYTFGLGNGLNIITEYFRFNSNTSNNYSTIALNYPLGIMNRIITAVYYNWDTKDLYRFISVQRDYDYLTLNLMAFWNPENVSIYGSPEGRNLMAGKGLQVMAILDF